MSNEILVGVSLVLSVLNLFVLLAAGLVAFFTRKADLTKIDQDFSDMGSDYNTQVEELDTRLDQVSDEIRREITEASSA